MSDPLTLEELDEIFENSLDVVAFGYHHVEQDDMQKIYNAARRGLESADEIERLRNTICMSLEQSKVGNWTVVRMYLNDALKDDKND
jgi:hypothetical protein